MRQMSVEFEDTIREDRLEQGRILYDILNSLESERKNAIIGFRCVNKSIPESLDNEDLEWVNFKSSIDTLAAMGICYINEEDMQELLKDFKEEIGELYSDHRAWSILTVLEINEYKQPSESYLEANVIFEGSKINPVPIDLVHKSESIKLITCKFNISTQIKAAKEKARELDEVSNEVGNQCSICLGTLHPKIKQRIENQVGDEFDEIISGVDILNFE